MSRSIFTAAAVAAFPLLLFPFVFMPARRVREITNLSRAGVSKYSLKIVRAVMCHQ